MRKITILLTFLLFAGMQIAFAQTRTITGKVTSSEDGQGIPGVTIQVKGTTVGTTTDIDGQYRLESKPSYEVLVFSYVGMSTVEIPIENQSVIDVTLNPLALEMEEVVVTALGVSREKKSLGYATQEIDGSEMNTVKTTNFIDNMQGKAAGVQIKSTGNLGGSTNVIIRGSSSLTGNNQALFVVDGVPIDNSNTNNNGQLTGRNGYDYGNAASDINPNDIESVNVLKGAAATALYGSRAANGVVMITTKKGKKKTDAGKAYGVTLNSNVTMGFVDKTTMPTYQKNYGAGYGPFYGSTGYFLDYDVDGDEIDDLVVPTTEDASIGGKFDPSLMVFQWDSFDPANDNYHTATPWVAAENDPMYFFDNSMMLTNSIDVVGGGDASTFRLSYTNQYQSGIMPNSELRRNNFIFNGSYDIIDGLTVTASANYINTGAQGRNSTGYSDNIMTSFRQWFQMNVDIKQQQEIYDKTGRNVTWNAKSSTNLDPIYWDNPYWVRYENYETDDRNRIIGYVMADWQATDWMSFMVRGSIDTYGELQEERKAVGSVSGEFGVGRPDVTSGYSRLDRTFTETNFDAMVNFKKHFSDNFNLTAFVGTNIRKTTIDQTYTSTNGGLIVPNLYSLGNSLDALGVEELLSEIQVNGIFASVSLGFWNQLFVDATVRRDKSSTLPSSDNSYIYPAVSASWLFSTMVDADWLQLGKIRLGYAQVGNSAPFASIVDTYDQNITFAGTALFSVPNTKNNAALKPERTTSIEAGLEMTMVQRRVGLDFTWYKMNTTDQILPVAVSYATGYSSKYVNAGEIQNSGVELQVFGIPVQNKNFAWTITANYAKNNNKVVSLEGDLENLQLARMQGGFSINARVGEPYGTIQGTDFVYDENGNKVVASSGYYMKTATSDIVLGDINPDFNLGLNNRFDFGNFAFSFLIDWQQGGSIFSLDQWYGQGTGLYVDSDYTNDLGNPVRSPVSEGGGLILEGVKEDGSPNDVRVEGGDYRVWGWSRNPNAAFVFDATYIKLREVVLSYSLPAKLMDKSRALQGVTFSLVGSNVWIISKDLPYADPEAGQSNGNYQGWQSGVLPATRNFGFNVNIQF